MEEGEKGAGMTKKICAYCGNEFWVDETKKAGMNRRYCSPDCAITVENKRKQERRKREKTGEAVQYERLCLFCGKKFTTTKETKVYCNEKCRIKAGTERQKVYGAEYREKKRQEKLQEEQKQKEKEQLHEANGKALANDMSYGQYYAMLYAQQHMHDAKKKKC